MITAIILAALPLGAAAQETGDLAEGRHLAGMFCSNCHIITPTKQAVGSNRVPTFSAVANRPSTTPASLRNSMLRPHPQISNLQATPDELRDLIAYILSLRGK
jgi:mono/diheme cytochrome c family protein